MRGLVLPQSYQIGRICEAAITVSQICEAGRIGIELTYLGLVLLDWFQDSQICEDVIATSHTSNLLRSISFGRSATDSGQIGSTLLAILFTCRIGQDDFTDFNQQQTSWGQGLSTLEPL